MKPLSPTLFELFDYDDQNDLRQEGLTGAVLDYTQHPYIIFGTFIRSVENFYIICQTYRNTYGDKFDKIEERLKHQYFDRVYGFLERFDETQLEHIIEARQFTDSEILYAVKSVLDFYESIEDYRKCDRLWKILLLTVGEKVGRT
jgi:hypothetical protein